jgi:hypothetical protein
VKNLSTIDLNFYYLLQQKEMVATQTLLDFSKRASPTGSEIASTSPPPVKTLQNELDSNPLQDTTNNKNMLAPIQLCNTPPLLPSVSSLLKTTSHVDEPTTQGSSSFVPHSSTPTNLPSPLRFQTDPSAHQSVSTQHSILPPLHPNHQHPLSNPNNNFMRPTSSNLTTQTTQQQRTSINSLVSSTTVSASPLGRAPEQRSPFPQALARPSSQLSPTASLMIKLKPKKRRRRRDEIERKYACPIHGCTKTYGTEGALKTHIKLKHPEDPIVYQMQNPDFVWPNTVYLGNSHHQNHLLHLSMIGSDDQGEISNGERSSDSDE